MISHDFARIGRRLAAEGLVSGNFGNLSVRAEGGFFITKTGCFLDDPGQAVFVPADGQVPREASSEFRAHRRIYAGTGTGAVVHAHPVHAVALSLLCDEVIPEDSEGKMFCPAIPVVAGVPGSDDLAAAVASALNNAKVVIARGHGTFAAGRDLQEAYLLTSVTEHSCRVLVLKKSISG